MAAMARATPTSWLSWLGPLPSEPAPAPAQSTACSLSRFLVAVWGGGRGRSSGLLPPAVQAQDQPLEHMPSAAAGQAVRTQGRLWCRPLGARLGCPPRRGQRAGVHSQVTQQQELATAAAGGNLRSRRPLWAQTCGEARIPRGTRTRAPLSMPCLQHPPVNANGCSWATILGGRRHEQLEIGPPACLAGSDACAGAECASVPRRPAWPALLAAGGLGSGPRGAQPPHAPAGSGDKPCPGRGNKESQSHILSCLNAFMFSLDRGRGGRCRQEDECREQAGGRPVRVACARSQAVMWASWSSPPFPLACVPLHLPGGRHSPVPGPCGPAAVMTPACALTVPLGSSSRDLFTSGSPVVAAEVTVVAGVAVAVVVAAAGSSGPTSHTRATTTGVDELAWAARSCRGLVRAAGRERGC